jgi:hypothetical protein
MGLSAQEVLTVCGAGSAIATAIFWGAYLLGKYIARFEDVEAEVKDHDGRIRKLENA